MTTKKKTINAVILAAGKGSRMHSSKPKAMQKLAGRPMISWIMENAFSVFDNVIVVIGPNMEELEKIVHPAITIIQRDRLGTGDAAKIAQDYFGDGDVAIFYADNPLITKKTMLDLIDAKSKKDVSLSLLGMRPQNPGKYGRIITTSDGNVEEIIEYKDASSQQREITLCNAGMICAASKDLKNWLHKIKNNNVQNEYYLTDVVQLAAKEGKVICVEGDEQELMGINSKQELASAEKIVQKSLRQKMMTLGVTLIDPESVYFYWDTKIDADVDIEPHVVFGPSVVVKQNTTIRSFSYLENCIIEENVSIGPYARIRPGTKCERGSHVGNFVELKNTTLGQDSKVNHLTYLGDAIIGSKVNIGAGTITCNYDGVFKHKTYIENNCFIGSNSILVAPVEIKENALISAGSVITEDVPSGAMAFGRSRQVNKLDLGHQYKNNLKKKKGKS